ncbi:hypothetical protein T492DRAFT_1141089 [Pavlovales sp. CCMP2436]|nr:hypothetical protein T492DRAFT_1141089 [Pavlovales sp. CCMP2436]
MWIALSPPLDPLRLLPAISSCLPPLPQPPTERGGGPDAMLSRGGVPNAPNATAAHHTSDAAPHGTRGAGSNGVSVGPGRVQAAAARYLRYAVCALRCQHPAVHQALLLLLAVARDEAAVEALVSGAMLQRGTAAGGGGGGGFAPDPHLINNYKNANPHIDGRYALRVCQTLRLPRAAATVLRALRLWPNALHAALALGDLQAAKEVARSAEDKDARARLWVLLARHVLGGAAAGGAADGGAGGGGAAGVAAALALVGESDGELSLDALLPLLPDTASLDALKPYHLASRPNQLPALGPTPNTSEPHPPRSAAQEPICRALEGYAAEVDSLRKGTDESARAAEVACEELGRHRALVGALRPRAACALSGLALDAAAVRAGEVLLFPCGHAFRRAAARKRLAELRAGPAPALPVGAEEEEEECVLCGEAMIGSLCLPLVDLRLEADRLEAERWRV